MATTFQRARSDEQREVRREAILDTAAAMLADMPVAAVSLNELSRRVGLAKSNVLRYFDSREEVLLELLGRSTTEWLTALAADVPAKVSRRAGFARRAEQLAAAFADSLVARPVLCDLIAAQISVLDRNVSAEAIVRHKAEGMKDADTITGLIRDALPELGEDDAFRYATSVWLMTTALWPHANPPEAVMQAREIDPRLCEHAIEFGDALTDYLTTMAVGLHAR